MKTSVCLRWPAMVVCASGMILSEGVAAEVRPSEPVDISSRLELLVDRHLVDQLAGAEFRLHQPQKLPLAHAPFTGQYATVIKDGDLFRGYYRGSDPAQEGRQAEITCYAESQDGHEWTFPELGIIEIGGSLSNNVIVRNNDHSHNFSPFLDTNPAAAPDQRYKALAQGRTKPDNQKGLTPFVSADGIHWARMIDARPVVVLDPPEEAFDSQNVVFWSEAEEQYVCYFRTWQTRHGKLRTISRTTSPDFVNWSKPVLMDPNLPNEHLYTNQTHPYFRAPHIYIALPSRFTAGQVDGVPAERGMLGSTDILFMTSRAGSETYDRLFTEAFIRPGLAPERWGSRANYAALNVVPTGPEEMSIYHAKSGHRYVLRTDGFISINAGARPGEMLTRPLIFDGNDLALNYSTSAAGWCKVEIQTPDGQPLPGFALEDCLPLVGDHIERSVAWQNGSDLGALAGRPVRVRFVMAECDLYALRFRAVE
ncbi:MAG: hypothetical protein LC725_00830 [Lentisphaerae bacterium]|nr:hypothetical protein [Lentisphaerota bacterium]